MSEYKKLIARTGIRFSGSPAILSPQLEDFGFQHLLHPLSSESDVAFRVVLYVPNLESHEVTITFPNFNTLEVRIQHGFRPMDRKHQQQKLSWSRDCTYLYRFPSDISKERMTASWTNDDFLVIQARGLESQTEKDKCERLVPTKVCAVLKPFMDIRMLLDSLQMHKREINSLIEYLERNGFVSKEKDILSVLLDYPGKPSTTPKSSPQKKASEGL